ncbi:MAG: multidrug efflux SMR transporter [Pseudomonadota bacterium]
MAWILLFLAGALEIGWLIGIKYSDGFTKLVPSVLTVLSMGVSLFLLSIVVRTIPLGTAYAIWTGIGAAGAVVLGIILFHEPAHASRLICVGLILAGVIGLKLVSEG